MDMQGGKKGKEKKYPGKKKQVEEGRLYLLMSLWVLYIHKKSGFIVKTWRQQTERLYEYI